MSRYPQIKHLFESTAIVDGVSLSLEGAQFQSFTSQICGKITELRQCVIIPNKYVSSSIRIWIGANGVYGADDVAADILLSSGADTAFLSAFDVKFTNSIMPYVSYMRFANSKAEEE